MRWTAIIATPSTRQDLRLVIASFSKPLVLASGSPYRRELLGRLRVPFEVDVPQVDETPQVDEAPAAIALRLSILKARTVADRRPDAIVVGSDQVAECDGAPFGKPGSHEAAVAQLRMLRGKVVRFHSGLCVIAPSGGPPDVRMLDDAEIEDYLRIETPYDCAGSAKAEGLGIALLDRVESGDPTALIGLPLIALVSMLQAIDYPLLTG